jgi:hypothetical protein
MLNTDNRYALIEKLADNLTDSADMQTIMTFFHNAQFEFFDSLSDEELLNQADGLGVDVTEYEGE